MSRGLCQPASRAGDAEPDDQAGTFPLVESQMDRFLLATRLGYPDEATETVTRHLAGPGRTRLADADLLAGRPGARPGRGRRPPGIGVGRGLRRRRRAGLPVADPASASVRAREPPSRSWPPPGHTPIADAYVLPDDVKAVAISVLSHRLVTDAAPVGAFDAGIAVMQAILERVPSPRP